MKEVTFVIDWTLPGLNEYINACKGGARKGSQLKRQVDQDLMWVLRSQCRKTLNALYDVDFRWYEKNKRRDHDNISSAHKFIFDALVKALILPDDGWKYVGDFTDKFFVDPERPRIEVFLRRREDGV